MVDDPEPEDPIDPGSYVPDFSQPAITAESQQQPGDLAGDTTMNHVTGEVNGTVFGATATNPLFEHFEPMLDADPFGLTASMHFPTPFSYEQSNTRHGL